MLFLFQFLILVVCVTCSSTCTATTGSTVTCTDSDTDTASVTVTNSSNWNTTGSTFQHRTNDVVEINNNKQQLFQQVQRKQADEQQQQQQQQQQRSLNNNNQIIINGQIGITLQYVTDSMPYDSIPRYETIIGNILTTYWETQQYVQSNSTNIVNEYTILQVMVRLVQQKLSNDNNNNNNNMKDRLLQQQPYLRPPASTSTSTSTSNAGVSSSLSSSLNDNNNNDNTTNNNMKLKSLHTLLNITATAIVVVVKNNKEDTMTTTGSYPQLLLFNSTYIQQILQTNSQLLVDTLRTGSSSSSSTSSSNASSSILHYYFHTVQSIQSIDVTENNNNNNNIFINDKTSTSTGTNTTNTMNTSSTSSKRNNSTILIDTTKIQDEVDLKEKERIQKLYKNILYLGLLVILSSLLIGCCLGIVIRYRTKHKQTTVLHTMNQQIISNNNNSNHAHPVTTHISSALVVSDTSSDEETNNSNTIITGNDSTKKTTGNNKYSIFSFFHKNNEPKPLSREKKQYVTKFYKNTILKNSTNNDTNNVPKLAVVTSKNHNSVEQIQASLQPLDVIDLDNNGKNSNISPIPITITNNKNISSFMESIDSIEKQYKIINSVPAQQLYTTNSIDDIIDISGTTTTTGTTTGITHTNANKQHSMIGILGRNYINTTMNNNKTKAYPQQSNAVKLAMMNDINDDDDDNSTDNIESQIPSIVPAIKDRNTKYLSHHDNNENDSNNDSSDDNDDAVYDFEYGNTTNNIGKNGAYNVRTTPAAITTTTPQTSTTRTTKGSSSYVVKSVTTTTIPPSDAMTTPTTNTRYITTTSSNPIISPVLLSTKINDRLSTKTSISTNNTQIQKIEPTFNDSHLPVPTTTTSNRITITGLASSSPLPSPTSSSSSQLQSSKSTPYDIIMSTTAKVMEQQQTKNNNFVVNKYTPTILYEDTESSVDNTMHYKTIDDDTSTAAGFSLNNYNAKLDDDYTNYSNDNINKYSYSFSYDDGDTVVDDNNNNSKSVEIQNKAIFVMSTPSLAAVMAEKDNANSIVKESLPTIALTNPVRDTTLSTTNEKSKIGLLASTPSTMKNKNNAQLKQEDDEVDNDVLVELNTHNDKNAVSSKRNLHNKQKRHKMYILSKGSNHSSGYIPSSVTAEAATDDAILNIPRSSTNVSGIKVGGSIPKRGRQMNPKLSSPYGKYHGNDINNKNHIDDDDDDNDTTTTSNGDDTNDNNENEKDNNKNNNNDTDSVISYDPSAFVQSRDVSTMKQRIVHAPPGKLGIVLDSTQYGQVVREISPKSPLKNKLNVGDIIINIDTVSTQSLSSIEITELMLRTAGLSKTFTVLQSS